MGAAPPTRRLLALVTLSTIGGLAFGIVQSRRTALERDRVVAEQRRTTLALEEAETARQEAEKARDASEKALRTSNVKIGEAQRVQAFYAHHIFQPLIDEPAERDRMLARIRVMAADAPAFFVDYPQSGPEVLTRIASLLAGARLYEEADAVAAQGLEILANHGLETTDIAADLEQVRSLSAQQQGRTADARRHAENAVAYFTAAGRPTSRPDGFAEAVYWLAHLDLAAGHHERVAAHCDLAEEILAEATEDLPLYRTLSVALPDMRIYACVALREFAEADRWLAVARERVAAHGDALVGTMPAQLLTAEAWIHANRGDWEDAERAVFAGFDALIAHDPVSVDSAAPISLQIAWLAFQARKTDVAIRICDRMSLPPFSERTTTQCKQRAREMRGETQ